MSSASRSVLKLFRAMIGDLDVINYIPLTRLLVIGVFVLYIMTMAVLLFNLFIGVIADVYVLPRGYQGPALLCCRGA